MTIFTIFFLVAVAFFVASIFADAARWPLWFLGAAIWIVTFIFWVQTW